jgi:hypothetical protein
MSLTFTSFNKLQKMSNYSADKLIGYEHIIGLHRGASLH